MAEHKQVLISRLVLLLTVMFLTACTESPFTLVIETPQPPIAFPTQRPVLGVRASPAEGILGQLVLENNCLSIQSSSDNKNYAVLWAPGFTLDSEQGTGIRVRNDQGQIIVRMGDEVYVGGSGDSSARDFTRLMDGPIPDECPPPYWLLGEWAESLTTYQFNGSPAYMVRREPEAVHQVPDQEVLVGSLLLTAGCLQIQDEETGNVYGLLWPPDFAMQEQGEEIQIIDGDGTGVAVVDEVVRMHGGPATVASTNISNELYAGRCSGPYWEISEVLP